MLKGIGVDIVKNQRMLEFLSNAKQLTRLFTEEELINLANIAHPTVKLGFLAKRFAAKEALLKALGTGIGQFSLQEITVLNDKQGKPYFSFSGKLSEYMKHNNLLAELSLADEDEYSLAFVTLSQI